MPKALIIGPDFYNFNDAVSRALCDAGFDDVRTVAYGTPVDPYDTCNKLRYKLARDKEAFRSCNRQRRQGYYRDIFDEHQPAIVFILNGEILLPETLDYFRSKSRVALWCFDSVNHVPAIKGHIDHVDRFYCYDKGDIEEYAGLGKQAFFLPQAADTATYHPVEGAAKDIDILFVGDLYHSPRRQEYIGSVIEAFPEKKIKVVGIYKPWYKNPMKALMRERRDIYTNHNVAPAEVNALYNRARVVLNIHNEQQTDGANPKVFEICASGAYQICDANPYLRELFPDGSVGLYETAGQLHALIREALTGDTAGRAAAARRKVLEHHTFGTRIATVIRDLAQMND